MEEEEFIPGVKEVNLDLEENEDNYNDSPVFDLEDYYLATELGLDPEDAVDLALKLSDDNNVIANYYHD